MPRRLFFSASQQGDLFNRRSTRRSGLGIVATTAARPPVPAVLESDLTLVRIPAKADKFDPQDVLGTIRVQPITPPVLKANTVTEILRKVVSRDELRPNLQCIYFDAAQKQAVATDGHRLLVLPVSGLRKSELLNPKTGKRLNERFPDYQDVIPLNNPNTAVLQDVEALRAKLYGLVKANRFIDTARIGSGYAHIRAEIRFDTSYYYFNPAFLLEVLEGLLQDGATRLRVELSASANRAMVVRDVQKPQRMAVLMPVTNTGSWTGGSLEQADTLPHTPVLTLTSAPEASAKKKAEAARKQQLQQEKNDQAIRKEEAEVAEMAKRIPFAVGDTVLVLAKPSLPDYLSIHAGETGTVVGFSKYYSNSRAVLHIRVQLPPEQGKEVVFPFPQGALKKQPKQGAKSTQPATQLPYFNTKGELVTDTTGKMDAEKLYYVQPDGTYEQGGDRRSPGWVKPPKKTAPKKAPKPAQPTEPIKRTTVKKHGNQNLRQPVSHFDGDLTLIRQFLGLTHGEVTSKRVKALHGRIEKAIVSRKVRKTSPHAELLTDIAALVKKTYAAMVSQDIEKVEELKFSDKGIVSRAQAVADHVVIQSAVPLLSRFINLQGTKPEAKTVATLLKAMEKQRRDVPNDDYAGPLAAAVALLKDWKPGTAVRITQHQLSGLQGLAGLGCPGDTCGCSAGK
ncbi:hypothetical protein [Hymenobacter metallilatus]|uniref:Uncharacterized protein n=1 Tax=Hymenobacter metallilatus TaxID=2493666 RepID=A0A3R9M7L1_9BACT|nr:hypothetical protein [Hymenobacter metallilatus]RSK24181.1 hypothetical protein EI290_20590 [Hymenobacter metallilatus]